MLPGPTVVLKIPTTGTLVKIETLSSGNTFGARYWTDGKREAPMLPDQPWLQRLPRNGEFFWTDECEQFGQEVPWESASEFANVPFAVEPTIKGYNRALAGGIASTPAKERYIRTRLWWALNDPLRHGKRRTSKAEMDRDNLHKLLSLLEESDPGDRLMAAELCRELGNFSRASDLLEFNFPEDFEHSANVIKMLTKKGDVLVREVA